MGTGGGPRPGLGPVLVVTAGERAARALFDDLLTFLPESRVRYFPPRELWPHETVPEPAEATLRRLQVLTGLAAGDRSLLVVAPAAAVAQGLPPAEVYAAQLMRLEVGDRVDLGALTDGLASRGYVRVSRVEAPGEFSRRGDVVDVWSPTEETPWRLEFFDDELESVRTFDPEHQRSLASLDRAVVAPAREMVFPAGRADALSALAAAVRRQVERLEKAGHT